ncbi:aspartic proteinase-like protein 1 isoform X2 [Impatiens glandulifera]|uniref:aspartic proteinase-like protein 1 isoform X2 n=1 Tax=Impatiens glandulifera TaxID=253017 RepID=UPI001FB0E066|nr:aspartic proteinase-like protein 1 isoform X2 [Impatiens glandulifera]
MTTRSLVCLVVALLLEECATAAILSSRLIHRFSDEVKALRVSRDMSLASHWPSRKNLDYYRFLVDSDVQRQKLKLGPRYQLLFPSQGSNAMNLGNDFGWLYYTWVNIGTPSVSYLVALDTGSDLSWVPCNCIDCAPLSASSYSNLDKDLNEYNPTGSSTSKQLNCSHQICELVSDCKSPKQSCPYTVNYNSQDTSSSGFLVEDILHLVSGVEDSSNVSVKAPVIIGCGIKQSGSYLDGIAPDGLLGLGLGNISVPSFLSRSGMVHNSFSLCFNADDSGTIFFGDQGSSSQQTTSFLPLDEKYLTTYIVGVEGCCIGRSCLVQTNFKALVDTGTSFTFLPTEIYEKVAKEFDGQINARPTTSFEGKVPWKYCYKSSSQEMPKIPSMSFKFASNSSFTIHNSVFLIYENEDLVGFCLALQPVEQDIAIIGQNFLTGYRLVFDQENMKLGWSHSDCLDGDDDKSMPLTPKGGISIPLPTTEQQSAPGGHAVAPAVAGRTPKKSSSGSSSYQQQQTFFSWFSMMFLLLWSNFLGTNTVFS